MSPRPLAGPEIQRILALVPWCSPTACVGTPALSMRVTLACRSA